MIDDAVSSELSAAAQRVVRTAADKLGSPEVQGPGWLRARVKNPNKLIERCADDAACLAKIGKKAQATAVLATRARPAAGRGVEITLSLIQVASETLVKSDVVTAADAQALERAFSSQVATLLDVVPAAAAMDLPLEPMSGDEPDDDPDELALAPLAPAPAAKTAAPKTAEAPPDDALELEAIDEEPADDSGLDLVALAPREESKGPRKQPTALGQYIGYGGVIGAGSGVLLFGVGAFFGAQAQAELTYTDGSTQRQASEQLERQHRNAGRGNTLMLTGAVVALVGAAALTLDALLFGGSVFTSEVEAP